jgi:methyl-accepting chemotaxis protein
MRLLRNANLRVKLVLLLLVPLLGLAWMVVGDSVSRRAEAQQTERLGVVVQLSVRLGNLVHEMQKERGLTAVFMSSNGTKLGSELTTQRGTVDGRQREMESFLTAHRAELSASILQRLDPAMAAVGQLPAKRQDASGLKVPPKVVINYFTDTHAALLASIGALASGTDNAELGRMATAYVQFLQAKEKTGVERANLANAFGANRFGEGQFFTVASAIAAQRTLLAEFELNAKPDTFAFYQETMKSPVVAEVAAMEEVALAKAATGGFGVDSAVWYTKITAKIDLMKRVEDRQVEALEARATAVRSAADDALRNALLLAALLVGGTLALSIWLIRRITQPLRASVAALEQLAQGDLTVQLAVTSDDEAGRIAKATNNAGQAMRGALQAFSRGTRQLGDSARDLTTTSGQLATAADETTDQASTVAGAAEEISANISAIASAGEQMTASIREIAQGATTAAQIAGQAVQEAEQTNAVVNQLGDSSIEIGDVLKTITSIAAQTHLLALNATIEAARAGEAGRGFAIVAGEVKELAGQTGQATEDITNKIAAIQADATASREAIARIQDIIRQIHDTQNTIASAVEEQLATTNEINRSVSEVSTGSGEIARTFTAVAEAAGGTSTGAGRIRTAAEGLDGIAGELQQLVDRFRY